MNPKVESIEVRIDEDTVIKLSPERAKALLRELETVLGETKQYVGVPYPVPTYLMDRQWPRWYFGDVICGSAGVSSSEFNGLSGTCIRA